MSPIGYCESSFKLPAPLSCLGKVAAVQSSTHLVIKGQGVATANRHMGHRVKQIIWLITAQTSQGNSLEGFRRQRRHDSAYSPSGACIHLVAVTVSLIVNLTQETTSRCVSRVCPGGLNDQRKTHLECEWYYSTGWAPD